MSDTVPSATAGRPPSPGKAPAGPRGHWLLGCSRRLRQDPLGLYTEAWRRYGDYVRIRLLPGISYSALTHPDAVEHVLQKNNRNYRKPDVLLEPMRRLVGDGLFTSEGDAWLRQRRLDQPAFHRNHLARLGPLMVAAAEDFVRRHRAAGPGQAVDILDEMMRLALRVAGTTLFSADISGDADAIGRAYRTGFAHVSRRMRPFQLVPAWLPTRRNREFARVRAVLDRVVGELIDARRRAATRPDDLLTLLLAAQDEETGRGMTDRQVKDEVLTLLTAGHETVGAALSWAWYLLGEHPRVQEELHDEVRGRLQGRDPTVEDLPGLPLARAVFEEALRLYPPAYGVPRKALQDDEVNGFPIPAKSIVILAAYVTHRHPDFWDEPERFKPDRFLGPAPAGRPKYAYFPFGGGPRVCIGNTFALLEGTLVLAAIAQRFRVELVPGQTVVPDTTFTLRPRDGVKVRLWPR